MKSPRPSLLHFDLFPDESIRRLLPRGRRARLMRQQLAIIIPTNHSGRPDARRNAREEAEAMLRRGYVRRRRGHGLRRCPGGPPQRAPDAMLHHVMSFLRAWEVARTCVLSRRWRHLWASAPCVDLRVWRIGRHRWLPNAFAEFVYRFLLERDVSAPVDTLRLLSNPAYAEPCWRLQSPSDADRVEYCCHDVDIWIRAAIKRKARVIEIARHPQDNDCPQFDRVSIASRHLKHLILSEAFLSDRMLRQLSSQCPCLEVLDLKDCILRGHEISSASLRSLNIVKCSIQEDLTIAAPNLLSLWCVKPYFRVPLFQNMGSIATATIVLDDSFLHVGYEHEATCNPNSIDDGGSDSGCSLEDAPNYCSDSCSDASTYEYNEVLPHNEDERSDDHGQVLDHCKHCRCKDGPHWMKRGYGRQSGFDDDEILGGHEVLHSLSNARSLKLLADAGEVILNRELKACPIFSNLKTLSLGEWCMAADFDPLVFFIRHSPNLERLFLELKLHDDPEEEMEDSTRPAGRSFVCTHLKMVKIKCSGYETRVHLLAELFKANGVPVEKIYVRRQITCHYIEPW